MWNVVTNVSLQRSVRISYMKWDTDSHIDLFLEENHLIWGDLCFDGL
jgi:hypothetical protein